MSDRRMPVREVSPLHEDRGIFNGPVVRVAVDLVPRFGRNSRDDIMIKGFVVGGGAIDVVFPGRRKKQAHSLQAQIQSLWSIACVAARTRGVPSVIDEFRYPVHVEGSWRRRFTRDDQGWQTRKYQLFAARWAIVDKNGGSTTYGEAVAWEDPKSTNTVNL